MTRDNNLLGRFELNGIPPAPRGVPQIEVEFDIDANGVFNVSAKEKGAGRTNKLTIENNRGRLSKEEIDRMVADAERYKDEDEKQRNRVSARNQLENYVFSVKQAIDEAGDKLDQADKDVAQTTCDDTLKWIDVSALAEVGEYEDKLREVQGVCTPVMTKLQRRVAVWGPRPANRGLFWGPHRRGDGHPGLSFTRHMLETG